MILRRAQDDRRRIPVIPTLLVLASAGMMSTLGFWQLDRKQEKEALLARYHEAQATPDLVALPATRKQTDAVLFRRAAANCISVDGHRSYSGRNHKGQVGLAHAMRCLLPAATASHPPGEQPVVAIDVVAGWSRSPAAPDWKSGAVEGVIAPFKNAEGFKLVATTPAAPGLEANAAPVPQANPNSHLAYAVQWFLFAAIALVIYTLVLRKRMSGN